MRVYSRWDGMFRFATGLGGFPFVAGSAPQTSAKESKAPLWVAIAALVVGGFGFVLAIFLFRRTSDDTSVNRFVNMFVQCCDLSSHVLLG